MKLRVSQAINNGFSADEKRYSTLDIDATNVNHGTDFVSHPFNGLISSI